MKCPIVGIVERETGPFAGAGGVSPLMIPMAKAKEIFAQQPGDRAGAAARSHEDVAAVSSPPSSR